eukprot:6294684-Amphidinium_carterae.1
MLMMMMKKKKKCEISSCQHIVFSSLHFLHRVACPGQHGSRAGSVQRASCICHGALQTSQPFSKGTARQAIESSPTAVSLTLL